MKKLITGALIALLLAPAAHSATPRLDLRAASATLLGGHDVALAGDVNGGGAPDWLVGNGARNASFVLFGEETDGSVDLDNIGEAGFVIQGAFFGDHASRAAGAGDVNGDGLDDIIVGAPGSDPLERSSAGSAYVVFGKASTDTVELMHFDLNAQGDAGFRIMGPSFRAFAGEDVSTAGDINGDGLDDLLVGAVFRGATYVVFGKDSSLPVDLMAFDSNRQGSQGYVIETPSPDYNDLYSVTGGLDVNGDGTPDPTIAVIEKAGGRGSVYVTFGQPTNTTPLKARELGEDGFTIRGTRRSQTGYGLAQVGDMNGDGRDEVVVGAPGPGYPDNRGNAYVLFGRTRAGTIRTRDLGRKGFRIDGTAEPASFGISVSAAPDLNGDARPDLLIGAPVASPAGRTYAGAAYVVFGKPGSQTVSTRRLGEKGFKILGAAPKGFAGARVASGGIDPERGPALLIGAWEGEGHAGGASYVVHP